MSKKISAFDRLGNCLNFLKRVCSSILYARPEAGTDKLVKLLFINFLVDWRLSPISQTPITRNL